MCKPSIFEPALFKNAAAIIAVLAIAGCANTAAMRDLAQRTADRTTADQRALDDFLGAQRQLNDANAHELRDLNEVSARENADTALAVDSWRFAGRGALVEQQAAAQRVQPADIVAALDAEQPAAAELADGGADASLGKAGAAFAAMARTPSTFDQMREFYASAAAVYDALTALKTQAASAGATAKAPIAGAADK